MRTSVYGYLCPACRRATPSLHKGICPGRRAGIPGPVLRGRPGEERAGGGLNRLLLDAAHVGRARRDFGGGAAGAVSMNPLLLLLLLPIAFLPFCIFYVMGCVEKYVQRKDAEEALRRYQEEKEQLFDEEDSDSTSKGGPDGR